MTPRALLASAWTLAILIVCWTPSFVLRKVEDGSKPFFIPNLDKLIHLGIFAVFAFAWMMALTSKGRAWKVLLAGIVLAILSELGQMMPIVDRDAGLGDGLADTAGVVVGIAAHASMAGLFSKKDA